MSTMGILIKFDGPDAPIKAVWLRDYPGDRKAGAELEPKFPDEKMASEVRNRFHETPPLVCMFDTNTNLVTRICTPAEAGAWSREITEVESVKA